MTRVVGGECHHPRFMLFDLLEIMNEESLSKWRLNLWLRATLGEILPQRELLLNSCSVTKSCLTLGNTMDCSMPGFPVLHHLPEFAQTHVGNSNRKKILPLSINSGNGTPLHYSCLENPRDGRAWWAAIFGVAQRWTGLKQLSSSSSSSSSINSYKSLVTTNCMDLKHFVQAIYNLLCRNYLTSPEFSFVLTTLCTDILICIETTCLHRC